MSAAHEWQKPRCVIIGGGLVGMTLAIGLKRLFNSTIDLQVFDQAPSFAEGVGGAVGMYPNGLAVLRDIDPVLLRAVRKQGVPYRERRWMKCDGTVTASALESNLCEWRDAQDEEERSSLGIRRWRLQKVLYEHAVSLGIKVTFNALLVSVHNIGAAGAMRCRFQSGAVVDADLLFGCDGVKSTVRAAMFGRGQGQEPHYTGVTVLMGAADLPREPGICFPTSPASGFHAVFYPTGANEQVFQVFFPVEERPETWRPLTPEEATKECNELAERMEAVGWHEQFLAPLRQAKSVLRVGLRARDPIPRCFRSRAVLLGDACHPPVPYLGQGFMAGLEDVGVLLFALKKLCLVNVGGDLQFHFDNLDLAFGLYQRVRLPRTTQLFRESTQLGEKQRLRSTEATSQPELAADEWSLWFEIKRHGTLPALKDGSSYYYADELNHYLKKFPSRL